MSAGETDGGDPRGWVVEGFAVAAVVTATPHFLSRWLVDFAPAGGPWPVLGAYLAATAALLAAAAFREGRSGARARWESLRPRPGGLALREGLLVGLVGLAVLGLLEWTLGTFAGLEVGPYRGAAEGEVARALGAIRAHPWIAVGLLSAAGVVEEVVYRGWGVLLVRRAKPSLALPALFLSSLLFGVAHGIAPLGGLVHYSLLGLVFGCVALAAGSVVPGALLHGLMNAAVTAAVAWGGG